MTKNYSKKKLGKRKYNYCEMCGLLNKTHCHRMLPGKEGGKYTLGNVKQLCFRCHSELHECDNNYKKIFRLWEKHTTKYMKSRKLLLVLLSKGFDTKKDYAKLHKYCMAMLHSARSCS